MGWQTIKQPNGKLAIWSTIVDDFLDTDLTVDQVLAKYREVDARMADVNAKYSPKFDRAAFLADADEGLEEMIRSVADGKPRPGDWTWEQAQQIKKELGR